MKGMVPVPSTIWPEGVVVLRGFGEDGSYTICNCGLKVSHRSLVVGYSEIDEVLYPPP